MAPVERPLLQRKPSNMKILVAYKRVVDYNVRIQVKPDGSGVVTEGVKLSANPFDEIALEEALRLRDKGIATEVIVATIAPADATGARSAGAAAGAARAARATARRRGAGRGLGLGLRRCHARRVLVAAVLPGEGDRAAVAGLHSGRAELLDDELETGGLVVRPQRVEEPGRAAREGATLGEVGHETGEVGPVALGGPRGGPRHPDQGGLGGRRRWAPASAAPGGEPVALGAGGARH